MIKHNAYYGLFASMTVPNHDEVGYWIDLAANSKGKIIKVFNKDINKWVILVDESRQDYVPPFIGSNGNWWIDNRDTGVKATAESPYIGEDKKWYTYDTLNKKYVDTGIYAEGLSAYQLAVKYGFFGTEEEWIASLSKASEDAAIIALEAADKANKATEEANEAIETIGGIVEDAVAAVDKAEELANNQPKIVNNEWWIYNFETHQYENTGLSAIGDAFTYKKEYASIAEMEADWATADVEVGEYVLINTGDVENEDDAKVYLKTLQGWKFVVDLSGMQGIQGWSAYEVAVQNGFVGTEEEWIQSIKQPALDAAKEALNARDQVLETEQAVKDAEAARVIAEQGRVDAENIREDNEAERIANEAARKLAEQSRVDAESSRVLAEDKRVAAENTRKTNEDTRIANEDNRIAAESQRASSEVLRNNAEASRETNEQTRIANENERIANENARKLAEESRVIVENDRVAAETARDTAEQERIANELIRQQNEAVRETQEADRQNNTAAAINAVNEAKKATETATTNAITATKAANNAAANANTEAARAKEYADNPPIVGNSGNWEIWDDAADAYVDTGWAASGIVLKGSFDTYEDLIANVTDPEISDAYLVDGDLYLWNGEEWLNLGNIKGPQGDPGKDAEITRAAIENVLTGEVTSHTHDNRYYTEGEIDQKFIDANEALVQNYYNKQQIDSKLTAVYTFKGSKPTEADLPTEGNIIGDVWNIEATDKNVAWTENGWDALGGTAELASDDNNGLMSSSNFTKLKGIDEGAQVNKIEIINKRGDLAINDKKVIIPEDVYIGDTEPVNDEILWFDSDENYEFPTYSIEEADGKFVAKEDGKELSSNDYTTADKTKVANLSEYVTGATANATVNAETAVITLDKKNPVNATTSTTTVTIPKVTNTTAGLMTAADKTTLDSLHNYDDSALSGRVSSLESDAILNATTSGTGNVLTGVSESGNILTFTKGTVLDQTAGDDRYVKKSGDSMTGVLTAGEGVIATTSSGFRINKGDYGSIIRNDGSATYLLLTDKGDPTGNFNTLRPLMVSNLTGNLNLAESKLSIIHSTGQIQSLTAQGTAPITTKSNTVCTNLNADTVDGYDASGLEKTALQRYAMVGSDITDSNGMTSRWVKYASIVLPEIFNDHQIIFLVQNTNNKPGTLYKEYTGILSVKARDDSGNYPTSKCSTIRWIVNSGFDPNGFRMYIDDATRAVELWCNTIDVYSRLRFTVLSETTRIGFKQQGLWTLYNNTFTTIQTPTLTTYLVSENAPNLNSQNEDSLAYWYENNENSSSTTCATGGNRNVIESLKSKFKRCIAKPYGDDAAMVCYCNETNSAMWPDGSNIEITNLRNENRMVHFPKYYHKTVERAPGIWRTYISEVQIDNDYIEEPEMLLSTFEATIGSKGQLCSVGSANSTASQTMATFVAQAKEVGPLWGIGNYRSHATIARMFCAYYKNTNISTANANIPCSGGTKTYNVGLTGGTIGLGNRDGKAPVNGDDTKYSSNFLGLEDCYYSKWEFLQGVNGIKGKWITYDGGSFPDKDVAELEAAGATNIRIIGYEPQPTTTAGYSGFIKKISHGKYGDVLPTEHGGSETTYYSDYSWFNPTGNRILLRSGLSGDGARCGVFMVNGHNASSFSWTSYGSRLAFYGKLNIVNSDVFKASQV